MINKVNSLLLGLLISTYSTYVNAQKVLLYENDFERPNKTFVAGCNSNKFVSQQVINEMYVNTATDGSLYKDAVFDQKNTAEILYHDDAETVYRDPQKIAGKYSLAINYSYDRLSLTFKRSDMNDLSFFNVAFDVSSALPLNINGNTCGVSTVINTPQLNVKLYQHAISSFAATSPPNKAYDSLILTGAPPGSLTINTTASKLTYNWARLIAPFDITGTTMDYLTVTFDLRNPGYIALDNFYIDANQYALPISLKYIKVDRKGDDYWLKWEVETASEFDRFEVQASNNGSDWTYFGMEAYKSSKEIYELPISSEFSFYRLKMFDLDDNATYSTVVKNSMTKNSKILLYPNPIKDYIMIESDTVIWCSVFDMKGFKMLEQECGSGISKIDTSDWPIGVYFISYNDNGVLYHHKIIKQ